MCSGNCSINKAVRAIPLRVPVLLYVLSLSAMTSAGWCSLPGTVIPCRTKQKHTGNCCWDCRVLSCKCIEYDVPWAFASWEKSLWTGNRDRGKVKLAIVSSQRMSVFGGFCAKERKSEDRMAPLEWWITAHTLTAYPFLGNYLYVRLS